MIAVPFLFQLLFGIGGCGNPAGKKGGRNTEFSIRENFYDDFHGYSAGILYVLPAAPDTRADAGVSPAMDHLSRVPRCPFPQVAEREGICRHWSSMHSGDRYAYALELDFHRFNTSRITGY